MTVEIREWTVQDSEHSDRLAQFLKQFEQASREVKVDVEYARQRYLEMKKRGVAHDLVAEEDGILKGAIGFIVAPDLHENRMVAIETFWFVAPQYRGIGRELMAAFEKRAKELGCNRTAMIHMVDSMPDILKAFYEKNGYRLVECHYVKDLA